MKKRSLLSLIIPLCALSGCSYRGDYKPLRDGDLLLREAFEIRDDSFANVDRHIKANDTFCIYFSKEGCSACEDFLDGFKEVVQEKPVAQKTEVAKPRAKATTAAKPRAKTTAKTKSGTASKTKKPATSKTSETKPKRVVGSKKN